MGKQAERCDNHAKARECEKELMNLNLLDHSSHPFQTHHSACDTVVTQDTFVIIDYKGLKKKASSNIT